MYLNTLFHISVSLFLSVLFSCQGLASYTAGTDDCGSELRRSGSSTASDPTNPTASGSRRVLLLDQRAADRLVAAVVQNQSFQDISNCIPAPNFATFILSQHPNLELLHKACFWQNDLEHNTILAILAKLGMSTAVDSLRVNFIEDVTSTEVADDKVRVWFEVPYLWRFIGADAIYRSVQMLCNQQKQSTDAQQALLLYPRIITLCEKLLDYEHPDQELKLRQLYDALIVYREAARCFHDFGAVIYCLERMEKLTPSYIELLKGNVPEESLANLYQHILNTRVLYLNYIF